MRCPPWPCHTMMGMPAMLTMLYAITTLRVAASLEAALQPLNIQPTRLRALSKQAEAALEQVNDRRARRRRDDDLQAEDDRQARVIEDMIKVIREVEDLDTSGEEATAAAWGESQAKNEMLRIAGSSVQAAQDEEGRAEKFREEATKYTQAAIIAATRMAQVAQEAEAIADHLRNQKVLDVIQSVNEENQVALSQAKLSIQMSLMAKQMVQEADSLAKNTLTRAQVAEVAATKALGVARKNTKRIFLLKMRVQKARKKAAAARAAQGR